MRAQTDTIKEKVNDICLDSRQTESNNVKVDQGQINVKPEVGHEISIEDLEIYTKNRINMPSLVNSDEEISSDDQNETESEEESQNDLNQNCVNKSNEALYSINIYITDIRNSN